MKIVMHILSCTTNLPGFSTIGKLHKSPWKFYNECSLLDGCNCFLSLLFLRCSCSHSWWRTKTSTPSAFSSGRTDRSIPSTSFLLWFTESWKSMEQEETMKSCCQKITPAELLQQRKFKDNVSSFILFLWDENFDNLSGHRVHLH